MRIKILQSGGNRRYWTRHCRLRSMPEIFMSYRRADAAATAGRLCDRLAEHFGPDEVFRDRAALLGFMWRIAADHG